MSHYTGPILPSESLHQIDTPGFDCTDFRQPAHLSIPRHSHPSPILLFVLGGCLIERYTRRSLEYSPATVVFRPAGELHQHDYGKAGTRCLAVAIQNEILQESPELRRLSVNLTHLHDASMFALGLKILREMHGHESVAGVSIEELLYKALAYLGRLKANEKGRIAPHWLSRARDLIHDCFLEELSLSQIAASVGVHPIYLAGTFRKYYGETVGNTIRKLRFHYALAQLTKADKRLTQLALDSGFFDHSHFTNFIKRQTGMTPSQLRKMIHQE